MWAPMLVDREGEKSPKSHFFAAAWFCFGRIAFLAEKGEKFAKKIYSSPFLPAILHGVFLDHIPLSQGK